MKSLPARRVHGGIGRSPYGERGLKLIETILPPRHVQSLSLRRAWIEILSWCQAPWPVRSLSLRRAWIEIYRLETLIRETKGRSPYGERGLKSRLALHRPTARLSLSLRRAWIEITSRPLPPPTRSSLSLRRAWIEMDSRPRLRCLPRRSPYGERGLKYQGVRRHDLGPRRSPYGERGLK